MAAGDHAALACFYDEYFALMYAEARAVTRGDEATCLDVVQDSMVKLLGSIRTMHSREQLDAWTRRLVRSVAIDHLRKQRRRARREAARDAKATTEGPSHGAAYHAWVETRRAWLVRALAGNQDTEARMLRLRYLQGWTLRAIGELLGTTPGAVDGRLRRLVSKLKKQAKGFEHEPSDFSQ